MPFHRQARQEQEQKEAASFESLEAAAAFAQVERLEREAKAARACAISGESAGVGNDPQCLLGGSKALFRGSIIHHAGSGFDWFTFVGKPHQLREAKAFLASVFGEPAEQKGGGRGIAHSFQFPGGTLLGVSCRSILNGDGESTGFIKCELSGAALAALGAFGNQLHLAEVFLGSGWHATRWDGRADFRSEPDEQVGLIDAVMASCQAEELCGAKCWNPAMYFKGGRPDGRMVCVGVRGGDGSGRYLRVYDKGLETKQAPAGEWERWEVEFTKAYGTADLSLRQIVASGDPLRVMLGHVFGAFEFRQTEDGATRRHRSREERPMVGWYADLIGGIPLQVAKGVRVPTSADATMRWAAKCALPPLLSLIIGVQCSFEEAVRFFGAEVRPDIFQRKPAWAQACMELGKLPAEAVRNVERHLDELLRAKQPARA